MSTVEGHTEIYNVTRAVPQGNVLSPVLFITCLINLVERCPSP